MSLSSRNLIEILCLGLSTQVQAIIFLQLKAVENVWNKTFLLKLVTGIAPDILSNGQTALSLPLQLLIVSIATLTFRNVSINVKC